MNVFRYVRCAHLPIGDACVPLRERRRPLSSLRYLMKQLKPYVAGVSLAPGQDLAPDRLELPAGPLSRLEGDRVYLLSSRELKLLSGARAAPGAAVLLGDVEPDGPLPALPEGCAGVFFACSPAVVHNALAEAGAQAARWEREFQTLERAGSLQEAVSLTARLAGDTVLLLDPGGQVMAAAGLERSPYLSAQAAVGVIPLETMKRVLPRAACLRGEYAVPGTDVVLYGRRLAHGEEEPYGILLAAGRSGRADVDVHALCACAAAHLDWRLFCGGLEDDAGVRALRECWQDIMEGRLTSSGEIQEALTRLPDPVRAFVRVAVISFEGEKGVPYRYLLTRLREIVPGSGMTVYQGSILVLLSQDERVFRLDLDKDQRLIGLLERYNGFMAVSNGTRRLDSLRSVFHLTQRTVVLARALRTDPSERIFFHEDYSMYCVIDLCVKRYMEVEGNDDPLYLMHPAVIHLTRYDREHNSSLRDVLFHYLINDRNLVKTAADVYMHRNTVINKVNKILELLKLDLEDPRLRQRLIFSCQMIRYYERVMQQEFRP